MNHRAFCSGAKLRPCQEYRSQYIIAGIDTIIRVWVTRGFQESVEEVVEIVRRAQQQQIPLA